MVNEIEITPGALYWQQYTPEYARLYCVQRVIVTHTGARKVLALEVGRGVQKLLQLRSLTPFAASGEPVFELDEANRLLAAVGLRTVKRPRKRKAK